MNNAFFSCHLVVHFTLSYSVSHIQSLEQQLCMAKAFLSLCHEHTNSHFNIHQKKKNIAPFCPVISHQITPEIQPRNSRLSFFTVTRA